MTEKQEAAPPDKDIIVLSDTPCAMVTLAATSSHYFSHRMLITF